VISHEDVNEHVNLAS